MRQGLAAGYFIKYTNCLAQVPKQKNRLKNQKISPNF